MSYGETINRINFNGTSGRIEDSDDMIVELKPPVVNTIVFLSSFFENIHG